MRNALRALLLTLPLGCSTTSLSTGACRFDVECDRGACVAGRCIVECYVDDDCLTRCATDASSCEPEVLRCEFNRCVPLIEVAPPADSATPDGAVDASADTGADASADGGVDAADPVDAASDGMLADVGDTPDAAPDGAPDGPPDAASDGPPDAAADFAVDAEADGAQPDAAADAEGDVNVGDVGGDVGDASADAP